MKRSLCYSKESTPPSSFWSLLVLISWPLKKVHPSAGPTIHLDKVRLRLPMQAHAVPHLTGGLLRLVAYVEIRVRSTRSFAPRNVDAAIPWSPTQLYAASIFWKLQSTQSSSVYVIRNCEQMSRLSKTCRKFFAHASQWTRGFRLRKEWLVPGQLSIICQDWKVKLSKISEPFRFATQSHCEISSFRLSLTTAIFDRYTSGKVETSWISCRSPWAFRNCKNRPCERRRACARHVAKCQASNGERSPRLGGRRTCFIMAMDGSPAIAQVPARTYLQVRLQYLHMHCVCVGSHGSIESHLPRRAVQCSTHIASIRKLPVVAGCRCLFFGSRVAACGIHATVDEENRPGRPTMQS